MVALIMGVSLSQRIECKKGERVMSYRALMTR
jgi:hypothetical protein